jgi:predicted DNA-binding protein with PD1-like motif
MQWAAIDGGRTPTYVVVGDAGDEALSMLTDFAKQRELTAAQITAVGAFSDATLGWFDRERRDYRRIEVAEQCEVLSLIGDVAVSEGEPQVHVHATVGLSDGSVRGGHLLRGSVWPTLEVVIRQSADALRKRMHREVGLALIELPRQSD